MAVTNENMSDTWNSGGDPWNSGGTNNESWNSNGKNDATWGGGGFEAAASTNEFHDKDAADNDFGDTQVGGAGGACRNCGQEGHFARECTEPRKLGPCFNCGEEGHTKAECPKPRVFKGTCNICNEEGHPAARCPSKPKVCTRCNQSDDHDTKDCKNNFYLNLDDVADITEDAAWSKVLDANLAKDVDDFKDALRMLQKAAPELTYLAVEKKLRSQNLNNLYLIALKKDTGDGYTLVNLQGEPEKTYAVSVVKSAGCQRPSMVDKWPKSTEENLERLTDAGIPMQRGIPYCRTCSKFGHASRECEEERVLVEAPAIICALCGEAGHRVRDCKEERKKSREPRTCKICGSEDHIAKECDQKPKFICRNCGGEDHKASECTEPRKLICNNCDKEGHISKECEQPKDWSRVTCRHCGEKGHASAARCAPGAAKKEDGNGDEFDTAKTNYDNAGADQDRWDAGDATNGNASWDNGASVAATGSAW